jgi:hypothetical protein
MRWIVRSEFLILAFGHPAHAVDVERQIAVASHTLLR